MKKIALLCLALAALSTPAFALVKGFHFVSDVTVDSPKHIIDCVNALTQDGAWSTHQHTRVEGVPTSMGARYKDAIKDGEDFVLFLMDEIHERGDSFHTAMKTCYVHDQGAVSLGVTENIF